MLLAIPDAIHSTISRSVSVIGWERLKRLGEVFLTISWISLNWAGVPLRTFETVVSYIAGTTTTTGLRVKAVLKRGGNETGERVSADEWRRLRLKRHKVCPKWNYTLRPRRRRH